MSSHVVQDYASFPQTIFPVSLLEMIKVLREPIRHAHGYLWVPRVTLTQAWAWLLEPLHSSNVGLPGVYTLNLPLLNHTQG